MRSGYLAGILALLALCALLCLLFLPKAATEAEIYVDGALWGRVKLTEAQILEVSPHNRVEVQPGRVRMLWADCPDGLCMKQGWSSAPAKPIVCLPGGVTVVPGGGSSEVDGVTG